MTSMAWNNSDLLPVVSYVMTLAGYELRALCRIMWRLCAEKMDSLAGILAASLPAAPLSASPPLDLPAVTAPDLYRRELSRRLGGVCGRLSRRSGAGCSGRAPG